MKLIDKIKGWIGDAYDRIAPQNKELDASSLPTNDTLEDHRREILRAGKKHSRPLSTTQRKVVLMSAIIAILLLVIASGLYIRSVYFNSSTSNLVGSIARLIPTPVLTVNDDRINHDTVLFHYSTATNVQTSEGGTMDSELAFINAIDKSITNKVINQIAARQNVTVSSEELDTLVESLVAVAGGRNTFEVSLMDTYGWTLDDFKRETKVQQLRRKLMSDKLRTFMQQATGESFESLASSLELTYETEELGEDNELLPELADASETTIEGTVSSPVYGDEGIYILYKPSATTLQYIYESYDAIDAYIESEIVAATVVNCLNRGIGVEGAIDGAWYSCIR